MCWLSIALHTGIWLESYSKSVHLEKTIFKEQNLCKSEDIQQLILYTSYIKRLKYDNRFQL
jgi:hypothetical protein